MEQKRILKTLEEIKTFSDPYRLSILRAYKVFSRPATVKEIADYLNEVPAKVHYHVKKLEKVDILNLVTTKEINGIIAKYYAPTAEEFIISSENENQELSKLIIDETQQAIVNVYETSKDIINQEINRAKLKQSNYQEGHFESIQSLTLYLSSEECDELLRLINKLKTNPNEKGKQKYHLFNVLFPVSEDNNTKKD